MAGEENRQPSCSGKFALFGPPLECRKSSLHRGRFPPLSGPRIGRRIPFRGRLNQSQSALDGWGGGGSRSSRESTAHAAHARRGGRAPYRHAGWAAYRPGAPRRATRHARLSNGVPTFRADHGALFNRDLFFSSPLCLFAQGRLSTSRTSVSCSTRRGRRASPSTSGRRRTAHGSPTSFTGNTRKLSMSNADRKCRADPSERLTLSRSSSSFAARRAATRTASPRASTRQRGRTRAPCARPSTPTSPR